MRDMLPRIVIPSFTQKIQKFSLQSKLHPSLRQSRVVPFARFLVPLIDQDIIISNETLSKASFQISDKIV
jgi:hypothetical protein